MTELIEISKHQSVSSALAQTEPEPATASFSLEAVP